MSPQSSDAASLTDVQGADFKRDGFVVVEQLYDESTMSEWKQTMQDVMQAEQELSEVGVRVWMVDQLHPILRQAMADAHVVAALNQLIGPNVEFLSAKAVYKDAETRAASPWHQDWQYWYGATKLSIWIALDAATPENGCLKVLPGSHTRHFEHLHLDGDEGFVNRIDADGIDGWSPVTVPLPVGAAIFFHDQLVHSSHPNTVGQDRWSLISTYRDAGVKDDSAIWAESMVVSGQSVNRS